MSFRTVDMNHCFPALRVCDAFVSSTPSPDHTQNIPRPFIFISAEDISRPMVSARYIETKREAELGIEALVANKSGYRGVYIRPSMFDTRVRRQSHPYTEPIS